MQLLDAAIVIGVALWQKLFYMMTLVMNWGMSLLEQ